MSQEDYKRGVMDATAPVSLTIGYVSETEEIPGVKSRKGLGGEACLNAFLEDRRKKLLTKKVTKWANVYERAHLLEPANLTVGHGVLYNHKSLAELSKDEVKGNFLGAYPIEIEVPL